MFFTSLSILIAALFYMDYKERIKTLDERIFSQMKLCSYTLECKEFDIDFVSNGRKETYKLYKEGDLKSYFPILTSQKNLLEISLPQKRYVEFLDEIKKTDTVRFIIVELIVLVLSVGFSIFSIKPLRDALHLTEEFIRDILHDFNTPISTLMLNISMLRQKYKEEKKFVRIQNALNTILILQNNLRAYLNQTQNQNETFSLGELLRSRFEEIAKNYPHIATHIDVDERLYVTTDKDSFVRIIDNILTNAFKYNKQNGKVEVFTRGETLFIKDYGIGIKDTKRVFERFYKENQRGIGIGLHIVKKLCDTLGIDVALESEVAQGSVFKLGLGKIAKKF